MIPVDGAGDGLGKRFAIIQQGGGQELPVITSLFGENAQNENGFHEGPDISQVESLALHPGLVTLQEGRNPFVILLRSVDGVDDLPIAVHQELRVHLGDEIQGAVRIVPGAVHEDPALLF